MSVFSSSGPSIPIRLVGVRTVFVSLVSGRISVVCLVSASYLQSYLGPVVLR